MERHWRLRGHQATIAAGARVAAEVSGRVRASEPFPPAGASALRPAGLRQDVAGESGSVLERRHLRERELR